jgi:hypothetical protein
MKPVIEVLQVEQPLKFSRCLGSSGTLEREASVLLVHTESSCDAMESQWLF